MFKIGQHVKFNKDHEYMATKWGPFRKEIPNQFILSKIVNIYEDNLRTMWEFVGYERY